MVELKEKTLNILYSYLLETYGTGKDLRSKDMLEHGLSYYSLKELMNNEILSKIKNGYYTLTEKGLNSFFYYGKKLISQKEKEKASLCFNRCFELDPQHLGSCFQMFLESIKEKDFVKAFEMYETLLTSKNEFYAVDMNYYLYLLNYITDIPDKYQKKVKEMTLNDIKVPVDDKRFQDIDLQNEIRTLIMQGKILYALSRLNHLMDTHEKTTVQDIIAKELLMQAANAEKKSKNVVVDLVKEGKIEDVVQYLLKKQEKHLLNLTEQYTLILVQKYLEMASSKVILEQSALLEDSIFGAINANNFALAQEKSYQYDQDHHMNSEDSIFTLLLAKVIQLCQEIKDNEKITISDPLLEITSFCQNQDWVNAFSKIKTYLREIGKEDWHFLIKNLITICVMDNDLSYQEPLDILKQIQNDEYQFDIFGYTKKFHESLKENNLRKAEIYMEIIDNVIKFHLPISTELLHQKILSAKDKENKNEFITEEYSEIYSVDSKESSKKNLKIKKPLAKETQEIVPSEGRKELFIADEKMIDEKVQGVMERGIILLETMDDERIKKLLAYILEKYKDISPLIIKRDNKEQIVLRYRPLNREKIDVQKVICDGRDAYNKRNYEECIKQYAQLLVAFEKPKSYVFALMGFAYEHMGNKQLAIDYLTIADAYAYKEGTGMDYKEKIMLIKGDITKSETKPFVKVELTEFELGRDTNNSYGMDNFDSLNHQIVNSKIPSVSKACERLGLNEEETNIVRLIYAKRFYTQGLFDKGDAFVKAVIKSGNMTKRILKIVDEIRKNRTFYQYRQTEKAKRISLSLLP